MDKHIWIAASNQEMYALLQCLTDQQAILRKDDGETITLDPMGFNHLPHTIHAGFDAGDILLHTTRFGVDDAGRPVCYPGWVKAPPKLGKALDALMQTILSRATFCVNEADEAKCVYVLPDAAFFIRSGSICFDA